MIQKRLQQSLYDYLAEGRGLHLFDENKSYTFEEEVCLTESLAAFFLQNGIKKGTKVALRATESVEAALLLFSLHHLGALIVLADSHVSLKDFLADSPVEVEYFVSDEEGDWLLSFGTERKSIPFECKACPEIKEIVSETKSEDPAFIIFTSGSTGKRKAVVISAYNVLANSLVTLERGFHQEGDRALGNLPMYHVFGLALLVTSLVAKYPIFFPQKKDLPYLLSCIEKYRLTRMNAPSTLYYALGKTSEQLKIDISSLRAGYAGGAPMTEEQFDYIENALSFMAIPVYGMSECVGIACASPTDPREKRRLSVGKPYDLVDVKIVSGEIVIKGAPLFLGYYGEESPLDENGYFHTGDTGEIDEEGYLTITGRIKDIIIRNGNNISAIRMEAKISSLPFVDTVAVFGMPDKATGEIPCIALTLAGEYDEAALYATLSKIEYPREIRVFDALPLTSSGKIDKQKLKELFSE